MAILIKQMAAFVAAVLLACGQANAGERIRIGIPQPLNVTFASFGFGVELGFFAEEGLDIEFVGMNGTGLLLPQIANKSVSLGLPSPDLAIITLAKGEPYPATFTYNWLRSNIYELAVKADSPIRQLADLKGKRLGIGALSWANIPLMRTVLREAGVEWGKDITVQPIGMGPAAWKQFADGNVDVMAYFTTEHERIAAAGIPIRKLALPEKYIQMFSTGVMFHNDTLANNPKLVEGFGRALAKSTVACVAAPRACTRGYWRLEPSSRPAADKEEAWVDANLRHVTSSQPSMQYFAGGETKEWGRFSEQAWSQHLRILHEGGQIATATPPIQRLYTNRFVGAFNSFDTAKVIEMAKAREAARK